MKKYLAISAGLLAGTVMMLSAAPAMARVNIDVNVGIPGVFVPAPVYVQPRPVYMQPRPVYYTPKYHHKRHYKRHHKHHYYSRHDRDGDGVSNRHDRSPRNPYRY